MEFKGTKGQWRCVTPVGYGKSTLVMNGTDIICEMVKFERIRANALLISKAPELFEKLYAAKCILGTLRRSMTAHPDCVEGSEFDTYTNIAQSLEDEIETLLKEATTI